MNKSSEVKVSFYNVIKTISDSLDLISTKITGHHKLVSYISLRLGLEFELNKEQLRKLVFVSLIHDIGIIYFDKEIDEILTNQTNEQHSYVGYSLIKDYFPFRGYDEILKNHHSSWEDMKNNEVNFLSNILHLADITAALINKNERNILSKNIYIIEELEKIVNNQINPIIYKKIKDLFKQQSFWLDMVNVNNLESLVEDYIYKNLDLNLSLRQVLSISEIVSHIIDFRSPYTATHSKGTASIASEIAKVIGFSKEDVKIIEIAGYFHDIGKISLPFNVINKKEDLTKEEWALMETHSYHSYYVLDNIKEIPKLKEWAGYHHEKLNGTGYPFRLNEDQLSIGSRIMIVSDIFTALAEDRPYRNGYGKIKIMNILEHEVKNYKIDQKIVKILFDDFDRFNKIRNTKQLKAIKDYNKFKKRTFSELEDIYNFNGNFTNKDFVLSKF